MATSTTRPVKHLTRRAQHRTFSSSSSRLSPLTASDAAGRLADKFVGSTVVRRQVIDANQLQKLSLTLGRTTIDGKDISDAPPAAGTPVPPGYHLVYFTPGGIESELGPDGTDLTFNAPVPFTRRMWAGGRMQWPTTEQLAGNSPLLRVGDGVEERTTLLNAEAKKSRSAGEMVLVEVEKEIWGPRGRAVVDQRSWVFRPDIDSSNTTAAAVPKSLGDIQRQVTSIKDGLGPDTGSTVRQLRWSPVGLFRFSALTFNGHKIHYNEDWTHSAEGHPGLVVHGPLNLINMLNYWRDVHDDGSGPREIRYRAMAPIYAGEAYQIRTGGVAETVRGREYEIVVDKEGVVCMKGEIV